MWELVQVIKTRWSSRGGDTREHRIWVQIGSVNHRQGVAIHKTREFC